MITKTVAYSGGRLWLDVTIVPLVDMCTHTVIYLSVSSQEILRQQTDLGRSQKSMRRLCYSCHPQQDLIKSLNIPHTPVICLHRAWVKSTREMASSKKIITTNYFWISFNLLLTDYPGGGEGLRSGRKKAWKSRNNSSATETFCMCRI